MRSTAVFLTGACAAALTGISPALAQSGPAPQTPPDPAGIASQARPVLDESEGKEVVVTGTNIRGIKPIGSSVIGLDRTAIANSGFTNLTEVARTIPQIQTSGFYREGNNNPAVNSTGGSALNLRGLGASATLLLVDGKRQTPNGTNTTYTESNGIPMVALERIEVIADGASAVYGSDAVAGVVNYVLRRKFEGIQAGETFNSNRIYDEWQTNVLVGHSWSTGSIVVAYERTRRDAALQGKSPFLRQDLTAFGGRDLRFAGTSTGVGGAVGNILVPRPTATGSNPTYPFEGGFDLYGLPTTGNGTGLTAASLRYNNANLIDTADYSDYVGQVKRDLISVVASQEVAPGVEVYVNAFYNHRTTKTSGISNFAVTLPSTTQAGAFTTAVGVPIPWYISGIPNVAAGAPLTVLYGTDKDIGRTYNLSTTTTYTVTGGVRAELFAGWSGDAYFTYGDDKTCGICGAGVNTTAFQALVNAGRINPLSTAPIDAATRALFMTTRTQNAHNGMRDFVVKANGTLFALPAGSVRAAIGAEHYQNSVGFSGSQNLTSNTNAFPASAYNPQLNVYVNNVPYSYASRTVDSGFIELAVPVVDHPEGLLRKFDLDGALRYDKYSDVGGTWNPKGSAELTTAGGFSFRGTWGTSYRAPGLAEKTPSITQLVAYATVANNSGVIPQTNASAGTTNVLQRQGANANLIPEKGTVWTLGVDWAPEFAPGLKLNATYYNITYRDQLVYFTAASFLSSPASYA